MYYSLYADREHGHRKQQNVVTINFPRSDFNCKTRSEHSELNSMSIFSLYRNAQTPMLSSSSFINITNFIILF